MDHLRRIMATTAEHLPSPKLHTHYLIESKTAWPSIDKSPITKRKGTERRIIADAGWLERSGTQSDQPPAPFTLPIPVSHCASKFYPA